MSRPTALKRLGLRARLLLGFVVVLCLIASVGVPTGLSFITRSMRDEAMRRVEIDLGAAWAAFETERERLQTVLSLASQGDPVRSALGGAGGEVALRERIEALRLKHELDILTVVDATGRVQMRSRLPYTRDDTLTHDPVVRRALAGEAASGTILVSARQLGAEGHTLVERAYIPLLYTERAIPTDRSVEDRGLLVEAAMPILDAGGVVQGALVGGILLNRKFALVDRIRSTVFGERTFEGKSVGTVTLFLGDVRIATNVMLDAGVRALGTRVSREVYDRVLERGQRFADRAFVVNDWYLSAYDPIRDPDGKVIGILYVGLLEKTYTQYRSGLAREYLAISLLAALLTVVAAFAMASTLRRPVARLLEASRRIAAGDLSVRVDAGGGGYELEELTHAFNSMAARLEADTRKLEEGAAALQKAYSEAAEKNRAYLEMLGFVTHELKSPLASIVFGIGSLRECILGPLNDAQQAALRSAAHSADYLYATIGNYLHLGRLEGGDLKLDLSDVPVDKAIIFPLVDRLSEIAGERRMRLVSDVDPAIVVRADRALLAAVFENLVSNAIKYGRPEGEIRIGAARADEDTWTFSVWNEGAGFAAEASDQLFRRFSRLQGDRGDTKPGTGLGLYVSRHIVERHGGRIWAESEPGRWARFSFTLPASARGANAG